MGRRLQRLASEAAKFLTVGGVATVVALVIFNGLVHGYVGSPGVMHEQPLVAFVIANTVGMLVSYRGSRSWAFRHREAVGVAGGRLSFFVINLVSMVIPLACLAFTRYVLGRADPVADNIAANVIGLGLGTLARFWAIRRFIFPVTGSPDRHPDLAASARR
ncbi:MAG: GtrA family protein [Nocardioidaceae bacterium]|nr:GtrA family protein [Nocardioidaceae bacterium]NUS51403.1 GtrA family protein [Nocardioidaceae bacterium]